MKQPLSSFTFAGYQADLQKGSVIFSYELQKGSERFHFQEKISFPPPSNANDRDLKPFLNSLLLILGISYWKTFCPTKIIIRPLTLTRAQADFWNLVYTKGLGEFFYRNTIDYRGLVRFPYEDGNPGLPDEDGAPHRSLVLNGGGKDSIVTAELLKSENKDFSLFTVSPVPLQRTIAELIGKPLIEFQRTLDPQLFALNKKQGVYNGHIPISAIWAFCSILSAKLYGFGYAIVSNEVSSNDGNVSYLGAEINHQWSKSFEFEKAFGDYVAAFVSRSIRYFSLLRPVHEVEIVRLFSRYKKYFPVFSSCNTNFTVSADSGTPLWCGRCPKCAFVFLLLRAFLPKEDVVGIFKKNLFEDTSLVTTYKELLGIEGFKPFECVGTPEESRWALQRILQQRDSVHEKVLDVLSPFVMNNQQNDSVLSAGDSSGIPEEFSDIISTV